MDGNRPLIGAISLEYSILMLKGLIEGLIEWQPMIKGFKRQDELRRINQSQMGKDLIEGSIKCPPMVKGFKRQDELKRINQGQMRKDFIESLIQFLPIFWIQKALWIKKKNERPVRKELSLEYFIILGVKGNKVKGPRKWEATRQGETRVEEKNGVIRALDL